MMLRPSMNDLATRGESYYSVVVGVAKRAREIADEALKKNSPDRSDSARLAEMKNSQYEKPVRAAVDEYYKGKFTILEDPSVITQA